MPTATSRRPVRGDGRNPNLTPLLDVVLQLITFFMMLIHFGSRLEGATKAVRLPSAPAALPGADLALDRLVVAVDAQGRLLVDGRGPGGAGGRGVVGRAGNAAPRGAGDPGRAGRGPVDGGRHPGRQGRVLRHDPPHPRPRPRIGASPISAWSSSGAAGDEHDPGAQPTARVSHRPKPPEEVHVPGHADARHGISAPGLLRPDLPGALGRDAPRPRPSRHAAGAARRAAGEGRTVRPHGGSTPTWRTTCSSASTADDLGDLTVDPAGRGRPARPEDPGRAAPALRRDPGRADRSGSGSWPTTICATRRPPASWPPAPRPASPTSAWPSRGASHDRAVRRGHGRGRSAWLCTARRGPRPLWRSRPTTRATDRGRPGRVPRRRLSGTEESDRQPPAVVGFRELWNHPATYQGRRVQVQGRLVRRFRQGSFGTFPPLEEAWVFSPAGDPFCLVFPAPASETEPTTDTPGAAGSVRFAGTFLKLLEYQGADGPRRAPLDRGAGPAGCGRAGRTEQPADAGRPERPLTRLDWTIALAAAVAVALVLAHQHLRRPSARPAVEVRAARTRSIALGTRLRMTARGADRSERRSAPRTLGTSHARV